MEIDLIKSNVTLELPLIEINQMIGKNLSDEEKQNLETRLAKGLYQVLRYVTMTDTHKIAKQIIKVV